MTNDNKQQQVDNSTESLAAETKKRSNTEQEETVHKRVRLRLIPVWLRVILVAALFIATAALGVMFGYSVLGDGDATDALKWDTWQHMLDIMNGVE